MVVVVKPTYAGFLVFLRSSVVGFSTTVLPDSEPIIQAAYDNALQLVNVTISTVSGFFYTQAVYMLGADIICNYAPDQAGLDFFSTLRDKWNILKFVSGTIQWGGDQGTQTSLVVPEAAKMFTLSDLQRLKTPWGRQYLALAQSYGPSVHGIT